MNCPHCGKPATVTSNAPDVTTREGINALIAESMRTVASSRAIREASERERAEYAARRAAAQTTRHDADNPT